MVQEDHKAEMNDSSVMEGGGVIRVSNCTFQARFKNIKAKMEAEGWVNSEDDDDDDDDYEDEEMKDEEYKDPKKREEMKAMMDKCYQGCGFWTQHHELEQLSTVFKIGKKAHLKLWYMMIMSKLCTKKYQRAKFGSKRPILPFIRGCLFYGEEENKITWRLDYTEDDTATTSTEGFISSCKIVLVVSTLHISCGGDMYKNGSGMSRGGSIHVHESKAHDNELLAVSQQIQRSHGPKLCVCWVEAVDVKDKMEGSQISCEWFHSPRRKKGSFRLLSLCLWL
ncbi:hypothetical protein DY000_02029058 [Brassica cretica]|uniref:Uncharacterized protein n=1 Tax=Brassica cretica TaxID=69181 RepID=A0ABQ7E1K1_BRACR|nr:hypothetical protein DY000_02029058 [Brassica cretica]